MKYNLLVLLALETKLVPFQPQYSLKIVLIKKFNFGFMYK